MPRTKLPIGSVAVTFRLPREIRERLLDKARREQMSVSALIRRALRREIKGTEGVRRAGRINSTNHRRQER